MKHNDPLLLQIDKKELFTGMIFREQKFTSVQLVSGFNVCLVIYNHNCAIIITSQNVNSHSLFTKIYFFLLYSVTF